MVLTKRKVLGDVLKYLLSSFFCLESATVKNTSGSTVTVTEPVGYPVKLTGSQLCLAVAGDEANVVGLILTQSSFEELANNAITAGPHSILKRGPAVVDLDQLPTLDCEGAAFNVTTLATRLLTLDIVCRSEPETVSEQTT